jgi:8-oxo-dGTP pyrophosphatase MutT (NUDIX family)
VTTVELVALTRARLAARERRVVVGGPLVKAAVLVPIVDRDGPTLVLTKRSDRVGTHRGQIGFPGGRVDPTDAGFLEAALR